MRLNLFFSLFTFFVFVHSSIAQKKGEPIDCKFVIKCEDSYIGKEIIVTKIGITGLSIKATEKVKKKLNLFSEDKITIKEEILIQKFSNICNYKSWFLDKIEFSYDENPKYIKLIPMIVQFHFRKS